MRTIAAAKAELEEFADTETTATITGDITPLEGALARAEAEAAAATATPIEFTVDADAGPALAAIGAVSAAARGATTWHGTAFESRSALAGALSPTGGGGMFSGLAGVAAAHAAGGGGGGGFVPGAAAGAAGGGDGGGGGWFTGAMLAKVLGIGAGAGMLGLPGAFSLLSLAGLGTEHIAMTGVGLAGSAVGAGLGGGLLAAGALGTMAVGSGSDMLVMKSTIADTKTLYTQYGQLNQAVLQYGAGSQQAATAQQSLNVQMALLGNTAGVQAEAGLARSAQALNVYWDQQTSAARVGAVAIGQQFLTLAHDYIPLVAQAAQRNFGIISDGLKPLFAWLEGPAGIGIFQNLETIFARNLPYAVDAFDQAIEVLLKSLNFLAPMTGGLVRTLDNLFTTANSPSGFARWQTIMTNLIGTFHIWEDLIKNLIRDIYDLFSQSSGTASSIVVSLDAMLIRLGEWERSTQGKAAIHNIFEVHKQEIDAILQMLPALLSSLGSVYLTVAPALTGALVDVLKVLGPILEAITSNAWGAWLVGLTLIAGKLGLLGAILSPLGGVISGLLVWLGKLALGWLGVQTAADKAAASEAAAALGGAGGAAKGLAFTGGGLLGIPLLGGLFGAGGAGGVATALGSLGAFGALLPALGGLLGGLGGGGLGNWIGSLVGGKGSTAQDTGGIVGSIGGGAGIGALIGSIVPGIGTLVGAIIGAVAGAIPDIVAHFDQIKDFFTKTLPGAIVGFFTSIPGAVAHFFQSVGAFFASLPGRMAGFMGMVLGSIGQFFQRLPGLVGQLAYQLGYFIGSVIGNVITFFMQLPGRIAGFMEQLPGRIAGFFTTVGAWFFALPGRIVGFFEGIPTAGKNALATVGTWFVLLPGRIWDAFLGVVTNVLNALGTIGHWIWQLPGMVYSGITGLAGTVLGAIKDLAGALGDAIHGIISAAISFIQGIISGIASHLPGSMQPQTRASGGAVAAGTLYLVGESGPELFMSRSPGYIVPNTRLITTPATGSGSGGSGSSVTINMTNTFTLSGLPQQIVDMVDAKMQSNNQQLVAAIGG